MESSQIVNETAKLPVYQRMIIVEQIIRSITNEQTRPALIISDNKFGKLPLKVIVPVTGWKGHYSIAPWMIKIEPNTGNGLAKTSSLDCF